jgi:hypothetical protein
VIATGTYRFLVYAVAVVLGCACMSYLLLRIGKALFNGSAPRETWSIAIFLR